MCVNQVRSAKPCEITKKKSELPSLKQREMRSPLETSVKTSVGFKKSCEIIRGAFSFLL